MPAVCILHAPQDEALAEKTASALARAGRRPVPLCPDAPDAETAPQDGPEGMPVIVLWTGAAAGLPRLHDSARMAMARGALIPAAVGGAAPPAGFETLPPVDLSGWSGGLDDPRWRFVLDEIELMDTRAQLADGKIWGGIGPQPAPADVKSPGADDDQAYEQTNHERAARDSAGTPRVSTAAGQPVLRAAARRRFMWRRFVSRRAAYGTVAGLAALTAASLALAPVIFPGPSSPQFSGPAQERLREARNGDGNPISQETPPAGARLSALQPAEQAPVLLAAQMAPPAAIAIPPTDDTLTPSSAAALDTDAAAGEIDRGDANNDTAMQIAADVENRAPDSDAMDNLIAVVTAEANAAASDDANGAPLRSVINPLPDELKETAYLGNYFKECVACPDMAALPPGSFQMGAPANEPARRASEGPTRIVTIEKRFAIGTREVTFDQWDACVAAGGCRAYAPDDHGWGRGKRPVTNVSYEDAAAYAAWLSARTGQPYRLPSEAEWEYAARAGTATPFAFGQSVTSRLANFNGNYPYRNDASDYRARTMPAASFAPNPFGLFDMHGNVWEWTSDCWNGNHADAPTTGAARSSGDCAHRVLKGGAWNTGAWRLRAAHRIGKSARAREFDNGFRVARDLE